MVDAKNFDRAALRTLTEREMMLLELIQQRGTVTAAEIEAALGGQIHNSTVRNHLRSLVNKGFIEYRREKGTFIYTPRKAVPVRAKDALRQLLSSFFGGAPRSVFEELVPMVESEEELKEIVDMIEEARRQRQSDSSE